MKKTLYLGVSLLALSATSTFAADLYRDVAPAAYEAVPATSWAGFYVGVNGGYGFNGQDHTADPGVPGLGAMKLSPSGGFGGGQLGYNFQRGNWVYGVETDIQGAGISDSQSESATVNIGRLKPGQVPGQNILNLGASAQSSLDWFGTVRARLGYSIMPNTLVYATGGFAYGGISDDASVSLSNGVISETVRASSSKTGTGYVLGGGIEEKISTSWSVKAEYQYINLGQDSNFDNKDFDVHTVRAGLNYHLGATGYEPLK
jgi:outer membrane immunogenic protein